MKFLNYLKKINEVSMEKDIDEKKPIIIKGVKGMKSKPFSKKFKNMEAYNKWCDSDEAGDCDVTQVMNENVEGINEFGIGYIITYGLFLVAQIHIWHFVTTLAQQHIVLGELYTEFESEIDSLAEKFIAQGGVLVNVSNQTLTTEYNDFKVYETLEQYRNLISSSIDSRNVMRPIADGLTDLMEIIDAKLYKFKLK
jgi:hypothetical protein